MLGVTMNYNHLRPYAAVTMAVFLVLLVFTGWVLYFAPHGVAVRNWLFLGVSKHQYKDIHLCLSVVATFLVLMHSALNFKSLSHYLKLHSKVGVPPLLCALVIVTLTVFAAFLL